MIIRGYRGVPLTYTPDEGEIVLARRTPIDRWVRAAVIYVRRNSLGNLKITVWWLEDDPMAGPQDEGSEPTPIKANTKGWVEVRRIPGAPPLIKQIPRGAPASD
jgi:hypothetical protein